MGLYPIKQKREMTCDEQEQLAEENFENSLFSSDIGFRTYSRECSQ